MKNCDHNLIVKKKEVSKDAFSGRCILDSCGQTVTATYESYKYAGGRYNGEELFIRKEYDKTVK